MKIMTVTEIIKWQREENKPVPGVFPKKPSTAKSAFQWMKEGMRPVSANFATIYQMRDTKSGYRYFDENRVIPMTDAEKEEFAACYAGKSYPDMKKHPITEQKPVYLCMDKKTALDFDKIKDAHIVCFDTETTGLSSNYDDILQISIVDNKGFQYDQYLRPVKKSFWPEAEKVHHITPEMVKNKPLPKEKAAEIQKIFDEADIICGFNVAFDIRFVKDCMGITVDPGKTVDVMAVFKTDTKNVDLPNRKLETAVDYYDIGYADYEDGAHNSLVDTIATLKVFEKQIAEKTLEKTSDYER